MSEQAYRLLTERADRGVKVLRVGPTEYGLATSDPVGDLPRRTQALEAEVGDAWRALQRLTEQGWEAKA